MWKRLNLFSGQDNDKPSEWSYDDLKTPKTNEEMIAVADNALEVLQKKLTSTEDEWIFMSDEDDILLEEFDSSESGIVCVRASVVLDNPDLERLLQDQFNPTANTRRQVYQELIDHKVIKQIDDNIVLSYSRYKSPTMVTNRDFICLWSRKKIKENWLFSVESINFEEQPFCSDYVRATTSCGSMIEPLGDNKYKLTMIEHIDPRGWVPAFVTNLFKGKVAERVKLMREVYGG